MIDFSFGAARQEVIGATEHPPIEQPSDRVGAGIAPRRARCGAPRSRPRSPEDAGRADGGAEPPRARSRSPAACSGCGASSTACPGLIWVKRMAAFPIGERFAVISLTAALWDAQVDVHRPARLGRRSPRSTPSPGRFLSSVAMIAAALASTLAVYRDDGPLANALGRASAARCRVPARGARARSPSLPLARRDRRRGRRRVRRPRRRRPRLARRRRRRCRPRREPRPAASRWLGPPVIRLAEYAALLWIGALAGRRRRPGRVRAHRARSPSATTTSSTACATAASRRRAGSTSSAWAGRAASSLGTCCCVAGALPAAFFVLAAVFGVDLRRRERRRVDRQRCGSQQTAVYEEEEDEGQ